MKYTALVIGCLLLVACNAVSGDEGASLVQVPDSQPAAASSASSVSVSSVPTVPASFFPQDPDQRTKFERAVTAYRNRRYTQKKGAPFKSHLLAQGDWQHGAIEVSGKVRFITTWNEAFVRVENFHMQPAPNVHLMLSTDLYATDVIDGGEFRVTDGHTNHQLSEYDIDYRKYKYALLYSQTFNVVLGYAELSPAGAVPL